METITHKKGDTFLKTCTTDVPLTGYSIASQVRDKSFKLISQLIVNITQTTPTGIYTLSLPTGTSSWPVGTATASQLLRGVIGINSYFE